jgi:hypothetical protein
MRGHLLEDQSELLKNFPDEKFRAAGIGRLQYNTLIFNDQGFVWKEDF